MDIYGRLINVFKKLNRASWIIMISVAINIFFIVGLIYGFIKIVIK